MEDPQQERRCRLAAWWVDFWLWIFALLLAYQLFTIGMKTPQGWWVPFLLWAIRRRVRKGEKLGTSLALSFVFPVPSQRWFLALGYLVAVSVALVVAMRAILGGERKGQGDAG